MRAHSDNARKEQAVGKEEEKRNRDMHAIEVDTATDRFLRIGVSRGSRSLMGGVIFDIPITLTIP